MNKGQPLHQENLLSVPVILQHGENGGAPEAARSLSTASSDYPQLEVLRICLGQALSNPVQPESPCWEQRGANPGVPSHLNLPVTDKQVGLFGVVGLFLSGAVEDTLQKNTGCHEVPSEEEIAKTAQLSAPSAVWHSVVLTQHKCIVLQRGATPSSPSSLLLPRFCQH